MSLSDRPFRGKAFFTDIRPELNQGRGMFAGQDGELYYVVMDSLFYKMNCFIRPDPSKFTVAAKDVMNRSGTRVIVNGSFFIYPFNDNGPGPSGGWCGQAIHDAQLVHNPGIPGKTSDGDYRNHAFIGREGGRAIWRYHVGASCGGSGSNICLPSVYASEQNVSLDEAVGGILPLTVNKQPVTSHRSSMWTMGVVRGKTIVAIHAASGCLAVISQKDWDGFQSMLDIAERLDEMGVTHALSCDGGSSSTLVIDGQVSVACAEDRDNTIPVGLAFELSDMFVGGSGNDSTFEVFGPTHVPGTDDSAFLSGFPPGIAWPGAEALITPEPTGGLSLMIISLGYNATQLPVLAAMALSQPAPLLYTIETDLMSGVTFRSPTGLPEVLELKAKVKKPANPKTDRIDYIEGTLTVLKSGSKIAGGFRARIRD